MSLSLNATNVRREKMIMWCTTGLLFTWPKTWKLLIPLSNTRPPTSRPPPSSPTSIETKDKSHLRMLRLWCELCVIVCPCFLDDCAERGPYLNTRKNKKTLCNQTPQPPLLLIISPGVVLTCSTMSGCQVFSLPHVDCLPQKEKLIKCCKVARGGLIWDTLMCLRLIHIYVPFLSACCSKGLQVALKIRVNSTC